MQTVFDFSATFYSYSTKNETLPQLLGNIKCFGSESSLLNCRYSSDVPSVCDLIEIQCMSGGVHEESDAEKEEDKVGEEGGHNQEGEEEEEEEDDEGGTQQNIGNQDVGELENKEDDNTFKIPFIMTLVFFVVLVLITILVVVLMYFKKERTTAQR